MKIIGDEQMSLTFTVSETSSVISQN